MVSIASSGCDSFKGLGLDNNKMNLQYHQPTFRLLQCEPVFSKKALQKLDSLEKALGLPVPASIREWYSLENAIDLLSLDDCYEDCYRCFSRSDLISLEDNVKGLKKMAPRSSYGWTIVVWSSGVWYGTGCPDDPDPLVRLIETDGSYLDNADEWCNRPFSAFVFASVWNCLEETMPSDGGTDSTFHPAQIDMLIDRFEEGPRVMRGDAPAEQPNPFTKKEGLYRVRRFQFFFFCSEGMVRLHSFDDPTDGETEVEWTACSHDEATLDEFVSQMENQGVLRNDPNPEAEK